MNKANRIIYELKNDYKTAETWLLEYAKRKRQYEKDSYYIRGDLPALGYKTHTNSNGSVVEYNAVRLFNLEYEEKWLIAVEMTEEILTLEKRIFLDVRRRAYNKKITLEKQGRKINYIKFMQEHYSKQAEINLGGNIKRYQLPERTIKSWWRSIIETCRLVALKTNCKF